METDPVWQYVALSMPLILALVVFYFVFKARPRRQPVRPDPKESTGRDSTKTSWIPQWVKNISVEPESATWTILGLWALVMGALYFYWPDEFKQFWGWHDHMVFIGLPVLLVIVASALDRPTKTPATKWIGGALLMALIAIYVIVVAEQFGMSFKTSSGARTIHRVLEPGEYTTVEIPYGYAFDVSCDVPGLITSPLRTPCVPEGGTLLGNAMSHITFQALDQELRVSVRLTPAS